ncbi:Hypothetical protein CINCED_3A015684 [Cinara cedri]|uniref:Uncharacterized protein n=1 Tax=Cinara cedri TaxID=506608 RepID=A0A5E4NHQ5_9HEMI|nr:Hypothetical protein CINCED_3A015684 [Cinara cedri]
MRVVGRDDGGVVGGGGRANWCPSATREFIVLAAGQVFVFLGGSGGGGGGYRFLPVTPKPRNRAVPRALIIATGRPPARSDTDANSRSGNVENVCRAPDVVSKELVPGGGGGYDPRSARTVQIGNVSEFLLPHRTGVRTKGRPDCHATRKHVHYPSPLP